MNEPTPPATQHDIAREFIKRGQVIQYVLALLLLFLIGWALLDWNSRRDEPAVTDVDLTELSVVSSNAVCPGEELLIKISVHIEGKGKVERDVTVQRVEPAKTVIFSEPFRFSIVGPIDQSYYIPWRVPERYFNFETGLTEELPPGEYLRIVTLSAQGYRYMLSDTEAVQFTIRGDCHDEPGNDSVGSFGYRYRPYSF